MTKCQLKVCEYCRPSSRGREKLNDVEIEKWWNKVKDQSGVFDYMLVPFTQALKEGTLKTRGR